MTTYEGWALLIQGVIGVALIVTFFYIYRTYESNEREIRERMRPYLGFEDVRLIRMGKKTIDFEVYVRNSGSLPAKSVKLTGKFRCDNEEIYECSTMSVVFPSSRTEKWKLGAEDVPVDEILKGSKFLEVELIIDYCGPKDGPFWTSKKGTFNVNEILINVEDDAI